MKPDKKKITVFQIAHSLGFLGFSQLPSLVQVTLPTLGVVPTHTPRSCRWGSSDT